jgi:DNA-binding response OmpR family regulator
VLIVEDEPRLASALTRGLRRRGIAADVAPDGVIALRKAASFPYSVVVLDRSLPALHGDEVCRRLRAGRTSARILMLTAAGNVDDRVEGLELGADDYLGKPFAFDELVARIRALARRRAGFRSPDVRLEPGGRIAVRGARPIPLGPREFAVLEALVDADGLVLTPEQLLELAWGDDAEAAPNTVRVTIKRLRRKLGDPPLITTVPGVGYRM